MAEPSPVVAALDAAAWRGLVLAAMDRLAANVDLLSELDREIGDGDHGITMARAASRVRDQLAGPPGPDAVDRVFLTTATAFLGLDGGATGPLFGTFFNGVATTAQGVHATDVAGIRDLFEGGLAAVRGLSRAGVGDKTLMDALIPAVAALDAAADRSDRPCDALRDAAAAADAGASSTRALIARYGRARHLGDRVIGHEDPGARSMAIVIGGFADACGTYVDGG